MHKGNAFINLKGLEHRKIKSKSTSFRCLDGSFIYLIFENCIFIDLLQDMPMHATCILTFLSNISCLIRSLYPGLQGLGASNIWLERTLTCSQADMADPVCLQYHLIFHGLWSHPMTYFDLLTPYSISTRIIYFVIISTCKTPYMEKIRGHFYCFFRFIFL